MHDPTTGGAGRGDPDRPPGGMADPAAAARARGAGRALAYVVLTECPPQVAEALVATLARRGIAAYVAPHTGSVGGYLQVVPPSEPLTRVWVDAAALDTAQALVRAEHADLGAQPGAGPGAATGSTGTNAGTSPETSEARAWRDIVAALQAGAPDAPAGARPWPAAEDVPDAGRPPGQPAPGVAGTAGRMEQRPGQPAADGAPPAEGSPAAGDAAGDEEHFVPPAPPPVPRPTGAAAYGAVALIAGCLVLLVPTMAGDPVGPGLLLLAVAGIVGGFGVLVARMRPGPPTDSGPDDGAVV